MAFSSSRRSKHRMSPDEIATAYDRFLDAGLIPAGMSRDEFVTGTGILLALANLHDIDRDAAINNIAREIQNERK